MATPIIIAAALLVGASTPPCSGPPDLEVEVVVTHEPIIERQTYRVAEIEELARLSGRVLRHQPLGFYTGGFGQTILVEQEQRSPRDGMCSTITIITVQLYLTNRLIEVARDLEIEGCRPEIVREHYRKRAAADDTVLSRYVHPVTIALQTARPQIQSLLRQGDASDTSIKVAVGRILERALERYDQVRADAFADVDSAEEIEKMLCEQKT